MTNIRIWGPVSPIDRIAGNLTQVIKSWPFSNARNPTYVSSAH